jgi:hypothetical protein
MNGDRPKARCGIECHLCRRHGHRWRGWGKADWRRAKQRLHRRERRRQRQEMAAGHGSSEG